MTEKVTNPVRYQLVDKRGFIVAVNESAQRLGEIAKEMFPDQEQDPERTGKGWDVQIEGAK